MTSTNITWNTNWRVSTNFITDMMSSWPWPLTTRSNDFFIIQLLSYAKLFIFKSSIFISCMYMYWNIAYCCILWWGHSDLDLRNQGEISFYTLYVHGQRQNCVVCTILILFEGYMLQDMKCKTIWIPTLVISWKTLRPIILWNNVQQRYISLTKGKVADPWNNWILKYLNFNFGKYLDRLSNLLFGVNSGEICHTFMY